jgi:uncharacterized protein YaeQ
VFKAQLRVTDLDRHYSETHALTIARHPSESDERMMATEAECCRPCQRIPASLPE